MACEAQGQCNDFEMMVCNNNGQSCNTSVCIAPFTYDQNGNRNNCPTGNNNNVNVYSQLGCIQSQITSHSACTNSGYLWKTKATTQSACLAQGTACYFPDQPYNYKFLDDPSTCTSCGGVIKPIYTWTAGQPITSQIQNTIWVQKQWLPVNQWALTIDQNKLYTNVIGLAVSLKTAQLYLNQIAATIAAPIPLLQLIVANCLTKSANSLTAYSATILNNVCLINPGQGTSSNCGPIAYATAANKVNTISAQLTILSVLEATYQAQIAANITAGNFHTANRRLLSNEDTNTALVQNSYNVTVGSVIGNGIVFNTVNNTVATICLPHSANPQVASSIFTVPDFIRINTVVPVSPLNETITIQGLDYCGNVSVSGTYFPILRATNWSILTPNSNSSSSSSSSSTPFAAQYTYIIVILVLFGIVLCVFMLICRNRKNHDQLDDRDPLFGGTSI